MKLDPIAAQYFFYIAGSISFAVGSLIGLILHLIES